MRRSGWSWVRALGAAGVLVVLVWRLGTGAFVDGLGHVDVWSVAAAAGIAVVTTLCCAWRWTVAARGLGVAVPLRSALAAYDLSQFLNVATPGGVLGDVHRAVRHGRDVGDRSRGPRSVVWERFAGQVLLIAMAVCALFLLPSPMRLPVIVAGCVGLPAIVVVGLLALSARSRAAQVSTRMVTRAGADLRAKLLTRHAWPGILIASAIAAAGHVLTFLIAARSAGSTASAVRLIPLAFLVLVAMGLPSIAGWGPREGMAAWAFGAAGLGAEQGVVTAVGYGVRVFVAALPGAVLLVTARLRRDWAEARSDPVPSLMPVADAGGDTAHA